MARYSKYEARFPEIARKLCKLGATDVEIADFFGIAVSTLNNWKGEHPELLEALKEGKAEADKRVEESLYQRALGYSHDAEKVFQFQGQIIRAPYREHYPPDTTAAIFWLKNRQPDKWRDVHKHEHGAAGEFDDKTPDELRDFVRSEAEALGLGSVVAEKVRSSRGSRTKPH